MPEMSNGQSLSVSERVEYYIIVLRGKNVILSFHLAEMYEVETKVLLQAVRRNIDRFPGDFMFQLTAEEWGCLRSQFVTLNQGSGRGPKYLPYAFTQEGVAMLSSVLRSKRAVQVNIEIMRAFVRLRRMLISNADLARRIDELEKKYDKQFAVVFAAIRELMKPPVPGQKRPLGFAVGGSREAERKE
jgi:phage regulator Rha-like protein